MQLDGRVALVTGASRGVGRAIALELARRGASLVLAARSVSEARGTPGTLAETAELVEAVGGRAALIGVDLNDPDSVVALAHQAIASEGHVDVLVNNAAFTGRAAYHDLDQLDLKNFSRQVNVNLTAPFLLAKELVPTMRARGGGVIANITSGAGLIGRYEVPGLTYGTTKAALNRLSTLLARDLADDHIVVFALDPSYTRTELVVQTADEAGLDASDAHDPEVPARVLADLIEARPEQVTGRVFKAVEGRAPILVADSGRPMPEGEEIDLSS